MKGRRGEEVGVEDGEGERNQVSEGEEEEIDEGKRRREVKERGRGWSKWIGL